jgi:hypothetical protein
MSGPVTRLPERLRTAGGGTGLEQRLLQSASAEQPSRELSERMAAGIGISAPMLLAAPQSVAPAPKAALGARALTPWLSGVLVVIAAVGATIALHRRANPAPPARFAPASASAPALALPLPSAPTEVVAPDQPAPSASPSPSALRPSVRSGASANDLHAQITLIDSARAAVSAGAGDRALQLLRQYESAYGVGSFRPEARALKIEALVAVGRRAEARVLAERFAADYPGSALAERVERIVGLTPPE